MARPPVPRMPRGFKAPAVPRIDRVIGTIQEWAILNKKRPHAIATALRMSPNALRDMLRPKWNPQARTLRRIERYMQFCEGRDHAS